jgi:hypothetical protein
MLRRWVKVVIGTLVPSLLNNGVLIRIKPEFVPKGLIAG